MLEINVDVIRGRVFVNLKGELNRCTINQFEREVNYLLYKQGLYYYIFDFKDLVKIDNNVISCLENKIMEIYLSYGKVVVNGLLENYEKKIFDFDKLLFNRKKNNFDYLTI